MTKANIVDAVKAAGLSAKDAEAAVKAVIESMTKALADKKDGKVQLVGFGTFSVKKRAARTGLNPQTKEKIKIPASKSVGFKAGKALKDAVNK